MLLGHQVNKIKTVVVMMMMMIIIIIIIIIIILTPRMYRDKKERMISAGNQSHLKLSSMYMYVRCCDNGREIRKVHLPPEIIFLSSFSYWYQGDLPKIFIFLQCIKCAFKVECTSPEMMTLTGIVKTNFFIALNKKKSVIMMTDWQFNHHSLLLPGEGMLQVAEI